MNATYHPLEQVQCPPQLDREGSKSLEEPHAGSLPHVLVWYLANKQARQSMSNRGATIRTLRQTNNNMAES